MPGNLLYFAYRTEGMILFEQTIIEWLEVFLNLCLLVLSVGGAILVGVFVYFVIAMAYNWVREKLDGLS